MTTATTSARTNAVDRAFVREIVPDHELGVELATIARSRAEHSQISGLAGAIIARQDAQIAIMQRIAQGLGVHLGTPDAYTRADAATLGVPVGEIGLGGGTATLARAKPFDRAFIDMMIRHEQGAIRMARTEFAKGVSPHLQLLAADIELAADDEIRLMDAWRRRWYGSASPSGGVPPR